MTFLLVAVTASWAGANVVHMPNIAPLILIYAVAFFPRALVGTSRAVLSSHPLACLILNSPYLVFANANHPFPQR